MLGCISVHDACVDISLQNQIKLTNTNPKCLKVKICCFQLGNLIINKYIDADNTNSLRVLASNSKWSTNKLSCMLRY